MKNIQIRIKKENMNTTITIKENILDLYSNTFFDCDYKDNKKYINKMIKNLVNVRSKNLSQLTTDFLLKHIQIEIEAMKKRVKKS